MADGKKLELELTNEQLRALKPLVEATGKLTIGGKIEGSTLKISFLACNSPFIACNAAFIACNSPFKVSSAATEE